MQKRRHTPKKVRRPAPEDTPPTSEESSEGKNNAAYVDSLGLPPPPGFGGDSADGSAEGSEEGLSFEDSAEAKLPKPTVSLNCLSSAKASFSCFNSLLR